jgi:hypothetical protein
MDSNIKIAVMVWVMLVCHCDYLPPNTLWLGMTLIKLELLRYSLSDSTFEVDEVTLQERFSFCPN